MPNVIKQHLLLLATLALFLVPQHARAADPEDALIYEVGVWVETCDVNNGGTDNTVSLRLDTYNGPKFYLDNPGNDRERGDWDNYSVTMGNISTLSDIRRIQFNLGGNDGWCVDSLILTVNGDIVFVKSDMNAWLDGNSSTHDPYLKIFSSELRNHVWWPEESSSPIVCRAPELFYANEIEMTLDGIVGDLITTKDGFPDNVKKVTWKYSSLTRSDSNTWRYKVKFDIEVKNYYDAEVEAVYYIDVGCRSGEDLYMNPRLGSSSVKWDIPWYVTVISGGAANAVNFFVDNSVENKLEDSLEDINASFTAPALVCPDININSSEDLELGWPSIVGTNPVLCY